MTERDIEATNVRPAFEASLRCGATEEELAEAIGWRRAELEEPGATVTGVSTYEHMELMAQKADYPRFVLTAVALHGAASLGAVGLACRSSATLSEAFACHQRFQHLTNRTAEYAASVDNDGLTITEHRFGEPRLGSLLISDYTLLVALHLLRSIATEAPRALMMRSRRSSMPTEERAAYEQFLGAPVEFGAERAQLVLDPASLQSSVATADDELSEYFQGVLHQVAGFTKGEPKLVGDVRRAIRTRLLHGSPSAEEIARSLGLGRRTLQRRLGELGHTYAELLEDTRRTMAERLLADPRMSLAEVAYVLGFAEKASFYRAFRRWHGVTPGAYRASLVGEHPKTTS